MKHSTLAFILLLPLFLLSCHNDNGVDPVPSGTIWGRLWIVEDSNKYALDMSGVVVSIDGTSHSGVSNTGGVWRIEDVPRGIYTIRFEKPGYSYYVIPNVQFIGGGEYGLDPIDPLVTLHKLPTYSVTQLTVASIPDTPNVFRVSGTLSEPTWRQPPVVCFYKTDSNDRFAFSSSTARDLAELKINGTQYEGVVYLNYPSSLSGRKVYLVAVPVVHGYGYTTSIYDPIADESTWTGVKEDGASEVIPITLQ